MGRFQEVSRCKKCGKIYQYGIPKFCYKCGVKLGEELPTIPFPTSYFGLMVNEEAKGKLILTDNCEKVLAMRKLLKWEIKGMERGMTAQEAPGQYKYEKVEKEKEHDENE